ncbi:MAG: (2Fe-2S)-binding protein [Rhodospirillales bacterium]|nr:(2Fe-2S)-binding protein [Rhodospirillales bacterium]
MYVCICNGFTDRDVKNAIKKDGACSVSCVHKSCQSKPNCGKCSDTIQEIIREETRS